MRAYKLEFAWRTDCGRVRPHNEDAVAVHPELGLVVVADGIGGASAGEIASRLAADTIRDRFLRQQLPQNDPDKARLLAEAAVEEANRAVWQAAQTQSHCSGMGTTVVVGFAGPDWLAFANVGDSRLYRLRDHLLEQLSRDHSLIQEVVEQGFFRSLDDARRYGIGDNVLTRALGSDQDVRCFSSVADTRPGDMFLFCTDGLSGMVSTDWLRQVLVAAEGKPLDAAADTLVQLANECGGNDNITLTLVRVGEPQDSPPPASSQTGTEAAA